MPKFKMNEKELTKKAFFGDEFSVDGYLSNETERTTLQPLLDELKIFRDDLQNLMADILRTETDSIVHLAESLTQLTKKIHNLFVPISQFKEEIKSISNGIISTKKDFETRFKEILHSYDKTQYIIYQQYMIKEIVMIQTLINYVLPDDAMFEQMLKRGTGPTEFLTSYINQNKLKDVDTEFLIKLDNFHLEHINKLFLNVFERKETSGIITILKMYKSLHAYSVAERLYRREFIRPALENIFNSEIEDSNIDQLMYIFQELLNVLSSEISDIHKLIEMNPSIKGFNFIINSYWLEVHKHLQETLHHYTAPGNPELFQKRYKITWSFLQEVMRACRHFQISYDIKLFEEHTKCFNLSVYYEIRYQQVSTRFETALMKSRKNILLSITELPQNGFRLIVCSECWNCFELCFRSDIFIDKLIEHFVKLSMLLLSRLLFFLTDVSNTLNQDKNYAFWETFYVSSLHDLNGLLNRFRVNDFNDSIYASVPLIMRSIVLKGIQANCNSILNISDKLRSNLIELVTKISSSHLSYVSSIPRLYRRTNKNIPSHSSNYVVQGVKPILQFHLTNCKVLSKDIDQIMDLLVKLIGEQYFDAVTDVLQSVCKIEESLRRLKHRNMTPNTEDVNIHSDESKIKRQIKLDVIYFVDNLERFSKENSAGIIKKLQESM